MTRSDLDRLRDARDYATAAREIGRGWRAAALEADHGRLHALLFLMIDRDLVPLTAALDRLIAVLEREGP